MHRHKFLRHAAAVLAAAALLTAVVLAGLAAALPDTLYTDGRQQGRCRQDSRRMP